MSSEKTETAADKKPADALPPATPPAESAPPVTPPADRKPTKEPIGLRYTGDGTLSFGGVPRHDLTVRQLLDLSPATFNKITAPNPTSGLALYVLTEAGEKAWAAKWSKE